MPLTFWRNTQWTDEIFRAPHFMSARRDSLSICRNHQHGPRNTVTEVLKDIFVAWVWRPETNSMLAPVKRVHFAAHAAANIFSLMKRWEAQSWSESASTIRPTSLYGFEWQVSHSQKVRFQKQLGKTLLTLWSSPLCGRDWRVNVREIIQRLYVVEITIL